MAFTLFILGALLLISAIRNTQDELFALVQGDFTGPANFIFWTLSILLIGAVGYIPKLKSISTAFLVLVILVLVLQRGDPSKASGGFFGKFFQQINTSQKVSNAVPAGTAATSSGLLDLLSGGPMAPPPTIH